MLGASNKVSGARGLDLYGPQEVSVLKPGDASSGQPVSPVKIPRIRTFRGARMLAAMALES